MRSLLRLAVAAFILATFNLSAESVIQLSATTYNVTEGNDHVDAVVQRTNDVDTLVSVDYATADGTATNGSDYAAVSGTLVFGAGETNKDIAVPILNDGLVEGLDMFTLSLSNPAGGAVLGTRSNAAVRITDNDTGLQFEVSTYSVAEGAGSVLIGVLRGDDGNFPVTVDYATADVTATNGVDYVGVTNTLPFAAGEKVKLFTVPILNDALKEPSRSFRLTLSNPTGGGVLGAARTATVAVVDNDPGVKFERSAYWVYENEGLLTVKVVRGSDVDLPAFTVDYATKDLTAVAGLDYLETNGTLAFAEGDVFKTLSVPILWNRPLEQDRVFTLILSNPSPGMVLWPPSTRITVLDATGEHRFERVGVLPDRSVQLTLGGSVHPRFQDYFDLYPIEVSTNLIDWTPLVTLQRTNSSTNLLTYCDTAAPGSAARFYRTMGSQFITPVCQPTGPFPAGMTSRLLTDPSRRNRYGISTNGSFMVSIWYPAVRGPGQLPGWFEDGPLARDSAWIGAYWGNESFAAERLPYFRSHALPEARCASAQAPYPILVYSPGLGCTRNTLAGCGPDLASHGYVVVAIDHFDAPGTVFPDGTILHGDWSASSSTGTQDRIRDVLFVLDQLPGWSDHDPILAGRLDLERIATMGFSWGAESAGEVARVDARCRAAILLDEPFMFVPELLRFGLQKPLLLVRAEYADQTLYTKNTQDAVFFQLNSIIHGQLVDYYWLSNPGDVMDGREAARTLCDYTVWFLDKYLKGISDPTPDPRNYRLISNFKQK